MECYANSPFMRFENKRDARFPDDERKGRVLGGQVRLYKLNSVYP
jgi:hypothetical protein